jgi:hypothetical protein
LNIQTNQPVGQSFVPTLTSIGFVSLLIANFPPPRGFASNAIVSVNLWSGSISNGTLLASTSDFVSAGFAGTLDFIFSSAVTVTPGNSYYLQPLVLSGGGHVTTQASVLTTGYPYGTAIIGGDALDLSDLWFREGIVVIPEPSITLLVFVGIGIWFLLTLRRGLTSHNLLRVES